MYAWNSLSTRGFIFFPSREDERQRHIMAFQSPDVRASKPPPDPHISPQDRFYTAAAVLLEIFVAALQSAPAKTIAKRLSRLAEGAWLPGMGDARIIGALTNKSSLTIEGIVIQQARTKFRVGSTPFFRLEDFAQPDTRKHSKIRTTETV